MASLLLTMSVAQGENPFDFATTPGKLPKNVVPTEYAIRVVPDVAKLRFTGSEDVRLEIKSATREIVFNALELEITSASIDGNPLPRGGIKGDVAQELVRLELPNELPPGPHTLSLNFSGKINKQGQGLFVAPYQEEGTGAKKTMLGTQFEATDARRMFPCWDEPSFRARFQLTALIPDNWTAVSNMPAESEKKIAGGKEVRFGTTPSMASYLNVLVAGELDVIEDEAEGVKIRVITSKGKGEMGRYALGATAQVLKYYNDYFGVPYPLPKLDQIALPGGFGGAMENWGGITYFETALLYDPNNSSATTKQNIFEVIAHEMAHQWFGDLVTMAWWDNLWLNEGFASWMGTKCTARLNPQWEVWLRRSTPRDPARRTGISKEQAMEGDARSTTHPIQQPIKNEAEANSAFDDITYRKGQSFIRMLESFLGEDVFRDGIRRYMQTHKYSNSTTVDLWNSLAEASGKPVADIAAGWTEQPGFPIVSVKREGEGKVTLKQERFTVHFGDVPAQLWKIPVTYYVDGQSAPASVLMTDTTTVLDSIPADRAFKLNVNGAGNYRVSYDETSWKFLLGALPGMSSADRVNLLSDTWALVQANRVPLSMYVDLVDRLPDNVELGERQQVITALDYLDALLASTPERDELRKYARSILRPAFDRIGWEPKPDEPSTVSMLRADLINSLGAMNDTDMISDCRERFERFVKEPKTLPPDLRPAVLNVVGRYADEKTWNTLHQLGLKSSSAEEKQNFYDALARATNPQLAPRTLQIALTDELPTSRAVYLVGKVARFSEHPEIGWNFAKANMKSLLAKSDALGANSYASGLFTFFSDEARITELRDYAKANLSTASAKHVEIAADEVAFRSEFKHRVASQIGALKPKEIR